MLKAAHPVWLAFGCACHSVLRNSRTDSAVWQSCSMQPLVPAVPHTVPSTRVSPPLQDGWLGAEGWDALRQMDSACDAFNAWQPAQLALETDFLADTPRARWVYQRGVVVVWTCMPFAGVCVACGSRRWWETKRGSGCGLVA